MSEITIPKTSFDTFNKILRAYGAFTSTEALSIKDLASKSNYSNTQIAKSNAFLLELKLIEKIDNNFKITPKGIEFTKALRSNDEETAIQIFRGILEDYIFTKDLIKYLEFNPHPKKEEIKSLFIERSNAKLDIADHRTGINGLIEMYIVTGILNFKSTKPVIKQKKKVAKTIKYPDKISLKDKELIKD